MEGVVQKISERAPQAVLTARPAELVPARPASTQGRAAPTCIFCDRPSGSVEYAWPEWICRLLIAQQGVVTTESGARGADPAVLERMEREVDATVTRVCATCRAGWMQHLENDVRPFLEPMIAGKPTTLGPEQQWLLARWAAKTAVVLEGALDTPVRTPRAACEHLRTVGVHSGTQVFVGSYDGDGQVLTYERDLFSRTIDGEPRYYPQASLVIGKVIIQVFAGPWRNGAPEMLQPAIHPLIPLVGTNGDVIAWPPVMSLDDGRYELARFGVLAGGAAWSVGEIADTRATVLIRD
jgi:hypothetical protein